VTMMMRIREDTHQALREVAAEEGTTLQDAVARAVELYRRTRFFEQMNAAYASLRADPVAWQQELAERAVWDATLMDGLERVTQEELEAWGPAMEAADSSAEQGVSVR
jgi:hypothetical protein